MSYIVFFRIVTSFFILLSCQLVLAFVLRYVLVECCQFILFVFLF
jgi:hypothetical protein